MEEIINNNPKGYAEVRNFTNNPIYKVIHVKDLFVKILSLYFKVFKKGYVPFLKGFFYYPLKRNTKCMFFNTINLGSQPWEVIFESTLPRLGNAPLYFYKKGVSKLASQNCEKIIALSECAYNNQVYYLNKSYPDYAQIIINKMEIKLPPQSVLVNIYSEKKISNDKIFFTLIGSDFFRKGGGEVLWVVDQLISQFPQISLNIVSSLNFGDYASQTNLEDKKQAISIINKYPDNINHYPKLDNDKVLELLKCSHVGLLPTWADSFGYSVLEAQASGCPVISTDLRALPEINNNHVGWLIKVPKDKSNNALLNSVKDRDNLKDIIRKNLLEIFKSILNEPQIIEIKGQKCLDKIKKSNNE